MSAHVTAAGSAPVLVAHAAPAATDLVRVYVWQIPVRVTHWLIAGSIVVLSVTGLYIGRPFMVVSGQAGQVFVMGWMKAIHFYAAVVFTAAVLARVIWMLTGNKYARWDKFLPVYRTRRGGLLPTFLFYTFVKRDPPPYVGHNPLAGLTYVGVFALYFLAIATGLVMFGASAPVESPLRWFGSWAGLFGGLQIARWIHHAIMWLLLGFAAHHVYSAILMASVEKTGTMDSIFTGYKWVERHALESGRYRWTHRGEIDE